MMRTGVHIVRSLCRAPQAISNNITPFSSTGMVQLAAQRTSFIRCRSMAVLPWPFSSQPRDFSLPNSSWGSEMRQQYEHYNSQCEEMTEEGEKKRGPWRRLPSYNRSLKFATGGVYLSKIIQSKARLFTRNIREQGAAFEYVMFVNKEEQKCVCVFQAGHLLEGPPGHVHGGAIATMIDTVIGTHSTYLSGPVMTANLNINYRRIVSFDQRWPHFGSVTRQLATN
ncbi:acyl-coenzyme A thioesterase THEM4 isoform X4 [Osmerus mordax]|uniref:acyl-coenzyme A thioesterase THEM4 isoform X4 n=1 Tax=Osmerus mordax TaxID=8014 RepID=UPI00350F98FA